MADPGREKRSKKALRAALAALDGAASRTPLAVALSDALRDEGELGPKERRAAAMIARGVTRELRRVDLVLGVAAASVLGKGKTTIPEDRTLLRAFVWLVAFAGEPAPKILAEFALPGPRRPRAVGDDVLAALVPALPSPDALPTPDEPVRAVAQRRSVPDFLAKALADDLGVERADRVLAALNVEPRLDLRANRLVATRDEVAARLLAEGVPVRPCPLAPDGLVAEDRAGLFGKAHAQGLFELQDEGSQLLAQLCAAAPGQTAIDFCAGSGGKSLALAAQVGRGGKVLACDALPRRLADLPQRARRAKAAGIVRGTGATPPAELRDKADVVLVDAPCSGLGGMRREADLRWRLDAKKLDALPKEQLAILRAASAFVRPGGRLVYGTCSPLRAEDEGVVEAFLAAAPSFELEPARDVLPRSAGAAVTDDGRFLRTFPDLHDTGAFFGAALRRRT